MALFSATMGTMASLAVLAGGAAVVGGAATSIVSATQSNRSPDISMPEVPKVEEATKTASIKAAARRTAIARSRTTYTSPLGETEEASVARHTLLGQ